MVGPLLGLAGYELLQHRIRPLLLIAVAPAVLSVLLVRLVREEPVPTATARGPAPRRRGAPLPTAYRRTVGVLVLAALVNSPDALLLLRVQQVTHSLVFVIVAYAAYNLVYALLSYPAGIVADRLGPARVYALGLGFFAVAYAGLALTTSSVVIVALLLLYGGYPALTDGVGKAWVSGLVPAEMQGRAQGLFQGGTGAAVLLAGLWAGLAWNGTGRLPLLVSGVTTALVALALAAPATRRWLGGGSGGGVQEGAAGIGHTRRATP